MKKHMILCVVAFSAFILCCFLSITGTMAYLSDKAPVKDNSFTVGNVDIVVDEFFEPPNSMVVGDNTYQKRVAFTNNGTVNAYVRVKVAFSEMDVADISQLSSNGGSTYHPVSDFSKHLPDGWAYQNSGTLAGYYYYEKALAPGETTVPLFTHVKTTFQQKTADTNRTINYTPRDYDIFVYVEGVQEQSLDGSAPYKDYTNAWTAFLELK